MNRFEEMLMFRGQFGGTQFATLHIVAFAREGAEQGEGPLHGTRVGGRRW